MMLSSLGGGECLQTKHYELSENSTIIYLSASNNKVWHQCGGDVRHSEENELQRRFLPIFSPWNANRRHLLIDKFQTKLLSRKAKRSFIWWNINSMHSGSWRSWVVFVLLVQNTQEARFFWGGNARKNYNFWVAWKFTLNGRKHEGLSIRSLKALSLLGKLWCWRFRYDNKVLGWELEEDGRFSVSSFRNTIDDSFLQITLGHNMTQNRLLPGKANLLVWHTRLGKL
ncbi:hypothetical protein OSB04_001756 [Centaurea solstitialis]|uniref:Uncharacterized protein n=1 Tax=Centaurea solstitialis TaxID=347529 RepID=A0AA38WSU9_9ASTR|nr:hypothetical protein OSB04_001756 [Centaurea solstitialis]